MFIWVGPDNFPKKVIFYLISFFFSHNNIDIFFFLKKQRELSILLPQKKQWNHRFLKRILPKKDWNKRGNGLLLGRNKRKFKVINQAWFMWIKGRVNPSRKLGLKVKPHGSHKLFAKVKKTKFFVLYKILSFHMVTIKIS